MKILLQCAGVILLAWGLQAAACAAGPSLTLKGTIRNQAYRPTRVAAREDGAIAVADFHRKQVYIFDAARSRRASVAAPGSPLSVAFAPGGGLYVGVDGDVVRMTESGEVTDRFSAHGTVLVAPVDIAVDPSGTVYVADRDANTVTVCGPDGSTRSTFGGTGAGDGKFNSPSGLAVDAPANEVFVVDAGNSRVQVFSAAGEFLRAFGEHVGLTDSTWVTVGAFARAQCVAVDPQHRVYVTDSGLDHVQIFSAQGGHLGFLGTEGHPSMRLRVPMGVVATTGGKLFVTALGGSEVREYVVDQTTDVRPPMELPATYGLEQNYPNPFNPATTIRFALPVSGFVTLRVYDVVGREVRTLVAGDRPVGMHAVEWDGTNDAGAPAATGIYFYRLDVGAGRFSQTNKMLFIK
jgi:DNA-binding beta-propeller fold protein YncE